MTEDLCMASDRDEIVQKNMERFSEFMDYALENPSIFEKLNGAVVVFDDENYQREKRNPQNKVIFAKKTYELTT